MGIPLRLLNRDLPTPTFLDCLRIDLPRFFAQEVQYLSFAVEAHDASGYLPRVLERRQTNNFFNLADVRAVHREYC